MVCFFSISFLISGLLLYKGLCEALIYYKYYINKLFFFQRTVNSFCFCVCFAQIGFIILFVVVISHYLCPITNHGAVVCLCKRVFTLTALFSPSAHCSVQNTHGDGILSGGRGLEEHQTTWLIRQCVDCICFPFVSHRLHWRHSVVIKPLSETELDKSSSHGVKAVAALCDENKSCRKTSVCRTMRENGTPPPIRNILL